MRRKEGPFFLLKFLPNPTNCSPDSLILSSLAPLIPPLPAPTLSPRPITKFYTWLPETVQNFIKFYGIRLKYAPPAIKFYDCRLLPPLSCSCLNYCLILQNLTPWNPESLKPVSRESGKQKSMKSWLIVSFTIPSHTWFWRQIFMP